MNKERSLGRELNKLFLSDTILEEHFNKDFNFDNFVFKEIHFIPFDDKGLIILLMNIDVCMFSLDGLNLLDIDFSILFRKKVRVGDNKFLIVDRDKIISISNETDDNPQAWEYTQ